MRRILAQKHPNMKRILLLSALLIFSLKLTAQDSLAYLNEPPLVIKSLQGEITLDGKLGRMLPYSLFTLQAAGTT